MYALALCGDTVNVCRIPMLVCHVRIRQATQRAPGYCYVAGRMKGRMGVHIQGCGYMELRCAEWEAALH